MKVIGVIPARIGSTRIPRKMLADIHGKTLIQRTYERSLKTTSLDALIVATDSQEIAESAREMGAPVIMWPTPLQSKNGTEGTSLALQQFKDFTPDIVVTIWGDEPLYPAEAIDKCVEMLKGNPELDAVTAADRIIDPAMVDADSVVKIVTDLNSRALYISRSVIPYNFKKIITPDYYHVIGAMAMRTEFLYKYVALPQSPLELLEGVEQLRILENGYKLGIVKGDFNNLGVNTPEELLEVLSIYKERLSQT
jgi:3-deoxy-manno-octulosonate cytidylyltransferase (CMP-KDO synthetase)